MSNEELWKKNHENKENGENDMCQGGKVGRKFPHLTNLYDEDQIEKKNERKRENQGKNQNERKKRKEKKNEGRKVKKKKGVRVG